jgi:hypothetical protein
MSQIDTYIQEIDMYIYTHGYTTSKRDIPHSQCPRQLHKYIHAQKCIHTYIHIYSTYSTFIHTQTHMYTYTHTYHIQIVPDSCMNTYIHTYIHAYIHTYIQYIHTRGTPGIILRAQYRTFRRELLRLRGPSHTYIHTYIHTCSAFIQEGARESYCTCSIIYSEEDNHVYVLPVTCCICFSYHWKK